MKKNLLILLSLLFLYSCRSNQTVFESVTEWNSLKIPFKIDTNAGFSPSGEAFFNRNKDIYISMKYFGFEILSMYANNDSVFVYDKTHNILIADVLGTNPLTKKKLNINQLQDLILGIDKYAVDYHFSHQSVNIDIIPALINDNQSNRNVLQWDFSVTGNDSAKTISGDLKWNYSGASINPEKMKVWNRPSRPKYILGIDGLYKLTASLL